MTIKEIAKNVIDTLPDKTTMDEIIHALYVQTKFDRGLKEIEAGKGISHEKAKKKMRSWIRDEK